MFDEFTKPIQQILQEHGIEKNIRLLAPPSPDLGDFCFVVNQIAGEKDPKGLADELKEKLEQIQGVDEIKLFERDTKAPIIYMNFLISENTKKEIQSKNIFKILRAVYDENYGWIEVNKGKTAIVEHTSANPISPLHVGNLRNSVQGDTFARILGRSGYNVFRHFYVNDVGLQVSFVALGYKLVTDLGLKPPIKIDLWIGQIYAIMNCFYTIQKLKRELIEKGAKIEDDYQFHEEEIELIIKLLKNEKEQLDNEVKILETKSKLHTEEKKKLKVLKLNHKKLSNDISDVIKYDKTFKELKKKFSNLFNTLYSEIQDINLQEKVAEYLKKYEKNSDPEITDIFREFVLWVLAAFQWTLERYNIEFDEFDFESDVTWSGLPTQIINQLAESDLSIVNGEAVRFKYTSDAIDDFCEATGIPKNQLPVRGVVPDLQLRRADGTALYAAKDIAYSIKKFQARSADVVYNVISAEQTLPQYQLLLPLHKLGQTEYAAKLKHYSYELVDLLGRTMSGRLAKYITADQFYDETYTRARMAKREADSNRDIDIPKSEEDWNEENQILQAVTLAATRFPLIETDPNKRIELDLDRELDFKRNTGPFVQYAHARCNSLIQRVKKERKIEPSINIETEHLATFDITEIANHLNELGNKIEIAIEKMDPSQIAAWCFQLAQMFMKFYESFPVLKEQNNDVAKARLSMVFAIKKGLATGLDILGIPPASQL